MSAPALQPIVRGPTDLPPLWLALALAAMVALHHTEPIGRWLEQPWSSGGWLLIVGGTCLSSSGAWRFLRLRTGLRPFTPATHLVATGAFRWTRNPMYLGFVVIACGVAICYGTIAPLFGPPLLLWWLDRRFVRREEAFLRQTFGADYEQYCRRVRRWL